LKSSTSITHSASPAALALRPVEIGLEPLVEVAVVAEARQRVGERQPRRL
jgi:hypothetical protein